MGADAKLEVLYEDNHLLCVVKPQNMPVQADSSQDEDLLTVCKQYIKQKYDKPGEVYIGLVHRLDRPVGGVMVFARTSKAAARLAEQIQAGAFLKKYAAVVCGRASGEKLENYLLKNEVTRISRVVEKGVPNSKLATLSYKCLGESGGLSLVDVTLETGRHHQIRVQLSHAGLPIYGDMKYNKDATLGNIALFAYELKFMHPTNKTQITLKKAPQGGVWAKFRDVPW